MKLSKLVASLRARTFKSGRALATELGVGNGHLAEIERGERWNLTVDMIARLAAGLKIRPDALFMAALESRDADQRSE